MNNFLKINKWPSEQILSFPLDIQNEILDEIPVYDKEYNEYIKTWILDSENTVFVKNEELLKNESNLDILKRAPQKINDVINKKWKINIKTNKVYDKNPERYLKYSKMSKNTAKPSVMVDGEIDFGCARWVASLLRGDEGLFVWKIRTSKLI